MTWSIKGICKCLMLFTLLAAPVSAFAKTSKESSPGTVHYSDTLAEVKVTAARIPLALKKAARSVTILDQTQIAQLPVNTVNDLL